MPRPRVLEETKDYEQHMAGNFVIKKYKTMNGLSPIVKAMFVYTPYRVLNGEN